MSFRHCNEDSGNAVKKIRIEDAVGTLLAHDLTEVRPGLFKGPAFSAGHRITKNDLPYLKRLGKRHLFILDLDCDQLHENDAALKLAIALSGSGLKFDPEPKEGKIQLKSMGRGLFKVDSEALFQLNMIPEIMCVSIHNNTAVVENSLLAAVRLMPLYIDKELLNRATDLISARKFMFEVKPFHGMKVRLIVTGNEIYDGLIEDEFETVVRTKLKKYGTNLLETIILPDDSEQIAHVIRTFLTKGTDLLIATGGMSVDPDDVTCQGIEQAGADKIYYGAAVTPGAMFQLAYFVDIPIMGIPACVLYHETTILDLILPRLLVGEKPDCEDLARLAHGGMCLNCEHCLYPCCPFGKI